jgi:hypothetical protein
MYTALLIVHSWLRWAVILSGLAVLGASATGMTRRRAWQRGDDLRVRVFTTSLDVQFLIGIVLYGLLSPVTYSGFADMGAAMRDPILRFYTVEHTFGMVASLALAHIGRARVRKAAEAARHRTVLIFFGMSIAVILLSIPWPGTPGGRALFRGFGLS